MYISPMWCHQTPTKFLIFKNLNSTTPAPPHLMHPFPHQTASSSPCSHSHINFSVKHQLGAKLNSFFSPCQWNITFLRNYNDLPKSFFQNTSCYQRRIDNMKFYLTSSWKTRLHRSKYPPSKSMSITIEEKIKWPFVLTFYFSRLNYPDLKPLCGCLICSDFRNSFFSPCQWNSTFFPNYNDLSRSFSKTHCSLPKPHWQH